MATKKKARWPWLVLAALLFALGAWLMSGSEELETKKEKKVSLPRYMTSTERKRNDDRRTMPAVLMPEVAGKTEKQVRDPVLAGMPSVVKKAAVVIEANAIRNSDLGDLMIECMVPAENPLLDRMLDAGFNPIEGLDRVAIADDALMITGDFSKTNFEELTGATGRRQFGENSEIYTRYRADGGTSGQFAVWKNQMMVFGDSTDEITTVLDRLDGKDADGPRALTEADAYGEVYGILKPEAFSRGLEKENPQLAALLNEAASQIKLHADVSRDVGVVADIQGVDAAKTQDLRKSLGTALTLMKLQAEAKGEKDRAEVLSFARVEKARDDGANFSLEAGLPYEVLEAQLKRCVAENRARRADAGR